MKLTHRSRVQTRRVRTSSRVAKRVGIVAALGVAALLMSGCDARTAMRFGWPAGVTDSARSMGDLWTWSVIAALLMGILVWALIFWTITFHRNKPGKDGDEFPRQTAYNVPLELTYTAVPFVIIAVLFYFTVIVQNKVEAKTDNPAVAVDVTAFQWNWKFGYDHATLGDGTTYNGFQREGSPYELQAQEATKVYGKEHELPGAANGRNDDVRNYLRFDKIETVGSSTEIPVLVLPTKRRIEFNLAAADVVHSFWVPEFLFKRDVMPFPKQNHTDPVFQIPAIDRTGAFVGRCAEMCGTYHSMMNFEVRAVTPEKFDAYIRYRQANPQATNGQALQHICETPLSVTTAPFDTRRGTSGTAGATGDPDHTALPNCQITTGAGQ